MFSKQIQVQPLPPRAQFTPIPVAAAASQVPGSAADLEASLGYSERQRMAREREEAAELEKKAQAVRGGGRAACCNLTSPVVTTEFTRSIEVPVRARNRKARAAEWVR